MKALRDSFFLIEKKEAEALHGKIEVLSSNIFEAQLSLKITMDRIAQHEAEGFDAEDQYSLAIRKTEQMENLQVELSVLKQSLKDYRLSKVKKTKVFTCSDICFCVKCLG